MLITERYFAFYERRKEMIDYARIESEISRIMDELENIPLTDDSRPKLIDELKSY